MAAPQIYDISGINIANLTADSFYNPDIYNTLFKITDFARQIQTKERLKKRASDLGIKAQQFNDLHKNYYKIYLQERKAKFFQSDNKTKFTDQPMELNCLEWTADDIGVYKEEFETGKQIIACSHPIMVTELLKNIQDGTEKCKIEFSKRGEPWCSTTIDKTTIASRTNIISLADRGILVTSENAGNLISYLTTLENANMLPMKKSSAKLGWHNDEFIPYGTVTEFDGEHQFRNIFNAFNCSGEKQAYMTRLGELRLNIPIIRILTAASLSAPLIAILNKLCYVLHYYSTVSETAKTVCMQVVSSMWGNPNYLIQSLNSTNFAFETYLDLMNNIPAYFDEKQVMKSRLTSKDFVYNVCQGRGSNRGSKNAGLRRELTWRTCVITNGENPMSDGARQNGSGGENRVIEICIDKKTFKDAPEVSDFFQSNYGHIGEQYIKILQSYSKDDLLAIYEPYYKQFLAKGITEKQSAPAALIMTADHIASKHIFNTAVMDINILTPYLKTDADIDIYPNCYENLMQWCVSNYNKFTSSDYEQWGKVDTDTQDILILNNKYAEWCDSNGISKDGLNKWLADNDKIKRQDGNYFVTRINGSVVKCLRLIRTEKQTAELKPLTPEEEQTLPF